tara:strand:+ start:1843 stop:2424 length:582 start_codon:yes stop_codon:yes gene_type:complete
MRFSTDRLRGVIDASGGLASSNRYKILLPTLSGTVKPAGGTANDLVDRRDLSDLCTAAKIPGKNITTAERVIGMEQIKVANGFNFQEVNLTFYMTNDYSARTYFQEWMDCIVTPTPPFEAGFHENYAKSVTIYQLNKNKTGSVIYEVELIKAYPISLSEMDLNNQAQTAGMELTVNFTYSNYLVKSQTDPNDL